MIDHDKPRICEVLGVEVGERFTIGGYPTDYGLVQACEDGKIRRVLSKDLAEVFGTEVGHKIGANALYYLLNHPERIIRKPRFTPEEVVIAHSLHRVWPDGELRRRAPDDLVLYISNQYGFVMPAPADMFGSLLPGHSVSLSDIVGYAV